MLSNLYRLDGNFHTGFDKLDTFGNNGFFNSNLDKTRIKVDMIERKEKYVIYAEIPGCQKDDVKLKVKNNSLSISVEKEKIVNTDEDNILWSERSYGSYTRSFDIPGKIDESNIKAKYDNGVLCITLPKSSDDEDINVFIE